jgi:hypothetical protein
MKTNLLRVSVLGALAAAAVYAQDSTTFQVNVPFDFIVGSQTLHAGQYTVDQGTAPGRVILKGAEARGAAIVMGQTVYPQATRDRASLVFHRYGDTYFLSEICGKGMYDRRLRPTKQEQELGEKRSRHETTSVAAVR